MPERHTSARRLRQVYNVIDARQAYLQKVVAEGLRALGHAKAAEQSIHLSYEIVALTPRCAAEMGYELSPEEAKKPYVEVSGRKGFGREGGRFAGQAGSGDAGGSAATACGLMPEAEQKKTAHAIAVGALRFFLLKFTRNAIIAFDFKDALSFEGETGPYCQYAVVRIRGIRRKGAEAGATNVEVTAGIRQCKCLRGRRETGFGSYCWRRVRWIMRWMRRLPRRSRRSWRSMRFNWRRRLTIFITSTIFLSEADEQKRAFLLRLTELVEAQLVRALGLLGIEAPEKM